MSETQVWEEHCALYSEADRQYRSGELKLAVRTFKLALRLAPTDSDTKWAIAGCYSDMKNPVQAERYYRRARSNVEWSRRGDLVYNLANEKFDQNLFLAAAKLYRLVPKSSVAHGLARKNLRAAHRKLANPSVELTNCSKLQSAAHLER